ncbi:MAG: hypothetical protein IPN29_14995 [Saprospiraceae bacterium]|nr:hypothetical protein [Saprospiraceae bacterium]
MKAKLINLALILTSFLGYLEWPPDNVKFLFQLEGEVLSKMFMDPLSVMHPFIVLPMIGQILLIVSLFQKVPGKKLSLLGLSCLSILLVLFFIIGLMGLNFKIALSAAPFLVAAVVGLKHYWKKIEVIGKS